MRKNTDGQVELILENRQELLIFFVIVVLCGVFFSLGYIIGRNTFSASAAVAQTIPIAAEDGEKPSAMPPPGIVKLREIPRCRGETGLLWNEEPTT